ncbi:MAG TPA: folylpolyglutamate synthase/dihydrofolate synthase family protein [Terriglobales bacterium]|nr:folylpolyglutamate synthase/dihydrofolate synthase family protein [Terriglobales bacterium]
MPDSRYEQTLRWLYRLEAARGMDFKLERMQLALARLGNPQQSFRTLHVAGTNGKGSVAALSHAMLTAAGYRVGLYTSPHLIDFRERIRIGNALISSDSVVRLAEEIRAATEVPELGLTFFELTTALSFLYFATAGVDLAVVEVGLGGRLDATNVVDAEVAVITSVGLDHEEYLGDSIAAVAGEKAGIIKPSRPVVVGSLPPAAAAVVGKIAASRNAPMRRLDEDFSLSRSTPAQFDGFGRSIDGIVVALQGGFQHDNAALAIAATLELAPAISDASIRSGCAQVRWPGRCEIVSEHPRVILDCAHNPAGIAALLETLPIEQERLHLLCAVMRDKRWQEMIDLLAPRIASAVVTSVMPPRGEEPQTVAARLRCHVPTEVEADPIAALELLLAGAAAEDTILVTGSLFLVAAVYPYFLRRQDRAELFDEPIRAPREVG